MRRRLALFESVWARGAGRVTVKATSIATHLIGCVESGTPLVFLYQQPETHLAVLLAGANAWQDLRGFAQHRYRRLAMKAPDLPPLAAMTAGELAALSWLAEVSTASASLTDRDALRIDFDEFLRQPEESLFSACRALGLETTPERCTSAVHGPVMKAYSKAPEHSYGPSLRAEVLADSRRRNAAEIARGMKLVDRLSSTTCGAGWH